MFILQYTIQSTNTAEPITPTQRGGILNGISFQNVTFQNNGSNVMRLGDSSVTSTKGIKLSPAGSFTNALSLEYSGTLNDWYVNGTANDILDILVIQ